MRIDTYLRTKTNTPDSIVNLDPSITNWETINNLEIIKKHFDKYLSRLDGKKPSFDRKIITTVENKSEVEGIFSYNFTQLLIPHIKTSVPEKTLLETGIQDELYEDDDKKLRTLTVFVQGHISPLVIRKN